MSEIYNCLLNYSLKNKVAIIIIVLRSCNLRFVFPIYESLQSQQLALYITFDI